MSLSTPRLNICMQGRHHDEGEKERKTYKIHRRFVNFLTLLVTRLDVAKHIVYHYIRKISIAKKALCIMLIRARLLISSFLWEKEKILFLTYDGSFIFNREKDFLIRALLHITCL